MFLSSINGDMRPPIELRKSSNAYGKRISRRNTVMIAQNQNQKIMIKEKSISFDSWAISLGNYLILISLFLLTITFLIIKSLFWSTDLIDIFLFLLHWKSLKYSEMRLQRYKSVSNWNIEYYWLK